jgi:DNA-binding response OmpR family regulator
MFWLCRAAAPILPVAAGQQVKVTTKSGQCLVKTMPYGRWGSVAEPSTRLLIVDDDPLFRRALRASLEPLVETVEAEDGLDGIRAFHRSPPDIVVVDIDVPRLDGYELLRRIHELGDTPVIMLAKQWGSAEIVRALRSGADDFMVKPVDLDVLAARIEAILRRTRAGRPRSASHIELDEGRLIIDIGRAEVWVRGQRIDLSATEYRLLVYLARRPDRVVSPAEILTHVWGTEYVNEIGYVKSYVRLVRRKIEENPRLPRYLVSRRGLGYTLVGTPSSSDA